MTELAIAVPVKKKYRAASVFSNKRGKKSHEHLNVIDVEAVVQDALKRVLQQYGEHGTKVLLPQALREMNSGFHAPVFAVDGEPGAKCGMLSRMREWKPIKPKLLQLLLEAYSGKTLEDGTDVLFKYCGLTKFSTRRASEYVIFAHRNALRASDEISREQREDAHRSKLALAFIATDALQVIRLFAIDEAKQRGELDNIRIDQHTSDANLSAAHAGRGCGLVCDAKGREYVERAIARVRAMCE